MEHIEVSIMRTEEQQEIEMLNVSEDINILPLPPHLSCDRVCVFSKKDNDISELEERSKATVKLCGLIIFYLIFMAVEIVGGVRANSLAILTDAAHLLSDVAACAISLFTVWASGWEATSRQSFGFNRLEVLGALLSVQLIWLISGILIYEAVNRILHNNTKVNGKLMFAISAFGFIINLIMAKWIGHHHTHHACGNKDHDHGKCGTNNHDHEKEELCAQTEEEDTKLMPSSPKKTSKLHLNINVQGAYLHVMADLIQTAGVMIAGAIIWAKPDWLIVDLICTLIFSVLVLSTTLAMLKNIFSILMERTPSEINIAKLANDLKSLKGVEEVHDLHVWAITVGKVVLSCHVIAEPGVGQHDILHKIRDFCGKTYNINHVTVQIE